MRAVGSKSGFRRSGSCGVAGIRVGLTVLAAAGAGLVSCLPTPRSTIVVADDLDAAPVASGLQEVTAVAVAPDGRIFIAEKNTGQIRIVAGGVLQPDPFASVPVNAAGERGLVGLAVHPDFADNGRLYVFYTRSDTGVSTSDPQAVLDNRVVYFNSSGVAAAGGEVFVASLPAGLGTENVGGRMAFDLAGRLLVALGDVGAAGSVQDVDSPVGKILRYNDDGTIPADNPRAGSAVFARGLRDPRGLAVDLGTTDGGVEIGDGTGSILVVDRYPGRDEINFVVADGNYGWPVVSGAADTAEEEAFVTDNAEYVAPLYLSDPEDLELVGGGFNPSTRYGPGFLGHFFVGAADRDRVLDFEMSAARDAVVRTDAFAGGFPREVMDVVFSRAGTLFVATPTIVYEVQPH